MKTIELTDDYGETKAFILLHTFGMDDENYAVMIPENSEKKDKMIFRILEKEDTFEFQSIDDEDELNDAIETYQDLMKEQG